MNRSRITVIAALVAVLAIAGGAIAFTTRGGDSTPARQRNAALDNKLDTTFGTSGYMLLNYDKRPFTVIDSVTTSDGTTYMVGTLIINGLRHAVVRSTKDGKTSIENFVLPTNNYNLEQNRWSQPLSETVPIAISVDNKGSVWVLADGYHAGSDQKSPFVTQLKKSDLSYYSGCGAVCGVSFASWSTMVDLAINPAGDRLLIVGRNGTIGYKPTSGQDIVMGYGYSSANADMTCSQKSEATNVISMDDRFYMVNSLSTPKTAIRLTFTDVPTAVECTNKLPLETVSDITTDADGTLYVYGKSTSNTVGYWRMQAGAMDSGTGRGSFTPRMIDVTTTDVFPGGITASSGTLHMAASVNSLNGPKTILEYNVNTASLNIATAIDAVSTEVTATTPPLLNRYGSTLTLIAPTSYSGNAATIVARFNAKDPLVGAPEWPVSQQTIYLDYGSARGLNFARPMQASSYSLDSGELPTGMTIHSVFGLRGVPQKIGSYTAKVKATNTGGSAVTTLNIRVSAVAPTEGSVTDWRQIDGNVVIDYIPGRFGSEADVITAIATDPSDATVTASCQANECVFPQGELQAGVPYDVRISHRNKMGEALSVNSLSVTPLGDAQKVSDIVVAPGLREATVSFTEPETTDELNIVRFYISIIDIETNVIVSAIGCDASPCKIDIDAPDSQRKYVAKVAAVYNDKYSMAAIKSEPFSVKAPKSVAKFEFKADMSYRVDARQFFVIPLMAQGSDEANIFAEPESNFVRFKSNPARLEGSLNPGSYEIPVTAETDGEKTIRSVVRIEVAPGKLPTPEVSFNFNTYDGKLSATIQLDTLLADAITTLKWEATVNNTVLTGQCAPYSLCVLNGIPFDSEVPFRMQAISDTEEASDWADMKVFTPSQEKPVSIDTASFTLQPQQGDLGIVEFAVRTSLARKFKIELQADATIQLNAETACVLRHSPYLLTYREEAVEDCPVDPYARLFNGDEMLAVDDDGASYAVYDPAALQEDPEARPIGISNYLSSRLTMAVAPGSYTVEVADYNDVMAANEDRRSNRSDIDFYLTIITTPEEAARLAKTSISAEPTPATPQAPVEVEVKAADVVVVPPNITPAKNKTLDAPKGTATPNKSGATITNIAVISGNKSLTLTPNVLTSETTVPPVKITLTPGNKSCTIAAGKACTIAGLSPWLTYSAEAIIVGDTSGTSTSGLRANLELKPKSKVNVATLGLTAAAKSVNATVAKKSLRATGSCSLNPAQTVLTVGATGSCSVSVRTTKTVKKKALVGPSLSLQAVIK